MASSSHPLPGTGSTAARTARRRRYPVGCLSPVRWSAADDQWLTDYRATVPAAPITPIIKTTNFTVGDGEDLVHHRQARLGRRRDASHGVRLAWANDPIQDAPAGRRQFKRIGRRAEDRWRGARADPAGDCRLVVRDPEPRRILGSDGGWLMSAMSIPTLTAANASLSSSYSRLSRWMRSTTQGNLDCSANPNYPAADAGHLYTVSVAGKVGGGSGDHRRRRRSILCKINGSAGRHAGLGRRRLGHPNGRERSGGAGARQQHR